MVLKDELIKFGCFLDNEYLNFYVELINKNLNTPITKYKTQKHHIIPRKFYYFKKLPENNDSSNLVNLVYKEHILAHYYLALCTEGMYKKVNEEALLFLINQKLEDICLDKLDKYQEIYDDLCRKKSENMKNHSPSMETRKKISESSKGKVLSSDTKKKLSEQKIGDKNPMKKLENRLKVSKALKGRPSKNIGRKMTDEQKLKNSLAHKGRICVIKNEVEKKVKAEELQKYLSNGWVKGRRKSTLDKIKKSNTGKKRTKEQKIAQSISRKGKSNYKARGLKRSEQVKQKFKEVQRNRVWYTNGEVDIRLKIGDQIPEGFLKGRKKTNEKPGNFGKICIHKGGAQTYIFEKDLQKYLNDGWEKGGLPRKRKS